MLLNKFAKNFEQFDYCSVTTVCKLCFVIRRCVCVCVSLSFQSLLMCPVHWAVHTTPTQAIVNSGGLPQAP